MRTWQRVQNSRLRPHSGPMRTLEKKHPLAVRWFHWVNVPVLFLMIWSGLLIYWSNAVYRLGLGNDTLLSFFPDWFFDALGVPYRLAEGMSLHFFFMWLFAVNGLLYVAYTLLSGEWRYLVPNRHSFPEAIRVVLHDLRLSTLEPPPRKFNGAQQIVYTTVILMAAGSLVTGVAIYKPVQFAWLLRWLGGYEWARWEHFWLMVGYVLFFVIHVMQVSRAGWNNFRAMVTGYHIVTTPASLDTSNSSIAAKGTSS
jgi:thiosulfate reductase cytochrome b subunit